ncbi:GNAT family N-acetyltransferase [Alkalihalobacillus macyae]|uniref:GNAT family N-acetyltransferase n=1 Tax=Guptibacillus hwajinpoensis TaxID=208199 RepID=UPI00273A8042|nr:GNAT family N-acetyltransferase [Alkalihalobacillus macyae]MDP4552481.1 GNAT family N-acetyltransferase [Alkalihalobacillus macyae]
MDFTFVPLTIDDAREIKNWNYNGDFDALFMTPYFTSFEEEGVLIGPGGCEGFVGLVNNHVSGLFEFTLCDEEMEIGLALAPSLVGKGFGADFVNQGIQFGLEHYETKVNVIKLEVEITNVAAIRVYEKAGFRRIKQTGNEIEMKRNVQH